MGKNKYAHLVPRKPKFYNPKDKTFRELPITGKHNSIIPSGTRIMFHGRVYTLLQPVHIPANGPPTAIGKFKLFFYI